MATQELTATDYDEIRSWITSKGGSPAIVKGTEGEGKIGVLRIVFPGIDEEEQLVEISWDDFFHEFEDKNLALVYSKEEQATGPFYKFIERETGEVFPEEEEGTAEIEGEEEWIIDEE